MAEARHRQPAPAPPDQTGLPPQGWLPDAVDQFDRELYLWVGARDHPLLDRLLPRLSNAANWSALWIGLSGSLWLLGGRRAKATAVRAVSAVGLTSALANLVFKRLPRDRPPQHQIPAHRHVRLPSSSSFPSGHSASAAAFATVVAHGEPALLPPVALLAAGVGLSRVHTGVHYPTDVLAGWWLGLTVGSAVCALRPVR